MATAGGPGDVETVGVPTHISERCWSGAGEESGCVHPAGAMAATPSMDLHWPSGPRSQ